VTTYTRWYPGPNDVPEYSTGEGLRAGIAGSAPVQHLDGSPGGSAPAGIWTMVGWQATGPAGSPYLQIDANGSGGAAGHFWRGRFRYSTAMLGTIDPSAWFNGTSDPIAGKLGSLLDFTVSYALNSSAQRAYLIDLLTVLRGSGLCLGTIDTNTGTYLFMPAGAPNGGDVYGIHRTTAYDPAVSEYGTGYNPLRYDRIHLGGTGYANLNLSEGNIGIGTSQSTVPVVVVQEGSQETNWNSLVETNLTQIFNSNTTVTHPDDLGGPDPGANEPAVVDVQVHGFVNAGTLPAIINGTRAVTTVFTLPGLLLSFLGAATVYIIQYGLKLADWLGAANALTQYLPDLPTLDGIEAEGVLDRLEQAKQTTAQERIATALECVCAQLKASVAEDGSTMHDKAEEIRASMDAVATSRSEIELQMKGIRVQAQGGVLEVPPP